jgi:hypothetical protein
MLNDLLLWVFSLTPPAVSLHGHLTRQEIENKLSELDQVKRELIRTLRLYKFAGLEKTEEDIAQINHDLEINEQHCHLLRFSLNFLADSDSCNTHELAAVYFETIGDKTRLNLLELSESLKYQDNPLGVLTLFNDYVYEPEMFAASIIWLLRGGVQPDKIVSSGLFHHYFLSRL